MKLPYAMVVGALCFMAFPHIIGSTLLSGAGTSPRSPHGTEPIYEILDGEVLGVEDEVCQYFSGLPKPRRAITGFVPCVPKAEIAAQSGKPEDRIVFRKARIARVRMLGANPPDWEGVLRLDSIFAGSDPMSETGRRVEYKGVSFERGDTIKVMHYLSETRHKAEHVFYKGPSAP